MAGAEAVLVVGEAQAARGSIGRHSRSREIAGGSRGSRLRNASTLAGATQPPAARQPL